MKVECPVHGGFGCYCYRNQEDIDKLHQKEDVVIKKDKTKRMPAEWERITGIKVLDAIGWSIRYTQLVPKPYHKKISRREFVRRARLSSIIT